MGFFETQGDALIFRQNGETVTVEAWMPDSLRVRAGLLSDLEEGSIALLPKEETEVSVQIEEWKASITNGKITAVMEVNPWGNPPGRELSSESKLSF